MSSYAPVRGDSIRTDANSVTWMVFPQVQLASIPLGTFNPANEPRRVLPLQFGDVVGGHEPLHRRVVAELECWRSASRQQREEAEHDETPVAHNVRPNFKLPLPADASAGRAAVVRLRASQHHERTNQAHQVDAQCDNEIAVAAARNDCERV